MPGSMEIVRLNGDIETLKPFALMWRESPGVGRSLREWRGSKEVAFGTARWTIKIDVSARLGTERHIMWRRSSASGAAFLNEATARMDACVELSRRGFPNVLRQGQDSLHGDE